MISLVQPQYCWLCREYLYRSAGTSKQSNCQHVLLALWRVATAQLTYPGRIQPELSTCIVVGNLYRSSDISRQLIYPGRISEAIHHKHQIMSSIRTIASTDADSLSTDADEEDILSNNRKNPKIARCTQNSYMELFSWLLRQWETDICIFIIPVQVGSPCTSEQGESRVGPSNSLASCLTNNIT